MATPFDSRPLRCRQCSGFAAPAREVNDGHRAGDWALRVAGCRALEPPASPALRFGLAALGKSDAAAAKSRMVGGTRSFRVFASTIGANARRWFGAWGFREFASTIGANSRLFCGTWSFRAFADGQGPGTRWRPLPLLDARRFTSWLATNERALTERGSPRGYKPAAGGSTISSTPESVSRSATVWRAASSTWTRGGGGDLVAAVGSAVEHPVAEKPTGGIRQPRCAGCLRRRGPRHRVDLATAPGLRLAVDGDLAARDQRLGAAAV